MKNMKKYIQAVAFSTLLSLFFIGCGSKNAGIPVPELNNQESSAPTSMVSDVTGDGETIVSSTQHITQEICENRIIDAEVVIPGKTQFSTYTLKRVDGDPDRLFDIFCPEDHGGYIQETVDYSNDIVYRESSGKVLVVRDDAISYSAYDVDSGETPMQEVGNLMYYYTQEHPQTQPHDLSFMTVAEMEKFARSVLDQLGIEWHAELLNCVTLDGSEILAFQKEMFSKSIYTEFGFPMVLTEAEDTCYLELIFSYDEVPLFGPEEPRASFVEDVFPPTPAKATILFNADGIQKIDVNCACIVEIASAPQKILSVEDAIACLKAKFDLAIQFGMLKITDIWLEYIPVKQEQTLVLTPYWCFKGIDEERQNIPGYLGNGERFNAITGKDLAYGG